MADPRQLTIAAGAGGRVGLARSRHDVAGPNDQSASKKVRAGARSFAHEHRKQQPDGSFKCGGCGDPISSNITRSKAHLLGCAAFLSSPEAEQAAASTKDSDLAERTCGSVHAWAAVLGAAGVL